MPRQTFERLAKVHHQGRRFRRVSRWSQFSALLMAQLTGRSSLRDTVDNFNAQAHKLPALGCRPLARSTLARLNEDKPYQLFEALFAQLLSQCQALTPGHSFRFKNKLYSLDASTIDLCLAVFPWARFRRTKGAIKLHVGLDHEGYLPEFVTMTEGNVSDITVGRRLRFPPTSIAVFDRGYTDYRWYYQLHQDKVFFVSRLKTNARYRVVHRRRVCREQGITSDHDIQFTGVQVKKKCPLVLRRIGYRDPDTGKHYVFITNHTTLSAKTIADIYKARWQIGVSGQGPVIQSVQVRPRLKDSGFVAGEVPWRESKAVEPSDNVHHGCMATHQVVTIVNVEVASSHAIPVAETVDNVRRQQAPIETSLRRRRSPAGYQRRHDARDYRATGEALGTRRRKPVEETCPITVSGKWAGRYQGGGSGRSTAEGRAAKRARREGPGPVGHVFVQCEVGVR